MHLKEVAAEGTVFMKMCRMFSGSTLVGLLEKCDDRAFSVSDAITHYTCDCAYGLTHYSRCGRLAVRVFVAVVC